MELLLNLFWLMLAVPVLLLSWRARRSALESGQVWRINSVVLVVCMLLLLFPVVSVTDDLLARGLDIEESSATKSLVKQSAGSQAPVSCHDAGAPAQVHSVVFHPPNNGLHHIVSTNEVILPQYDP